VCPDYNNSQERNSEERKLFPISTKVKALYIITTRQNDKCGDCGNRKLVSSKDSVCGGV